MFAACSLAIPPSTDTGDTIRYHKLMVSRRAAPAASYSSGEGRLAAIDVDVEAALVRTSSKA